MSQSLTIRIPDTLRKRLQVISKMEGKPESDIVRDALKKHLMFLEYDKLRNMAIPYAEANGLYTDEDVFKFFS